MRTLPLYLLAWTFLTATSGFAAEQVSFRTDVMAVLSKAGCNQGTCHGNANGKGGFKLSLRGDTPESDFLMLTRAEAGRRVNPADPDQSLLLLKPTMQLPHLGGRRFDRDSPQYRILHDWIAAGARRDAEDSPRLTSLAVSPREGAIVPSSESVQITATAAFNDGSRRDITDLAVYEPSEPSVEITTKGLVSPTMLDRLTEVTVAVRFLDQQRPVRVVFLPERPEFTWRSPAQSLDSTSVARSANPAEQPESLSEIDRIVFSKLRRLRINPSDLCDDTTFVRRAYLDLTGVIPTVEEARAFVESDNSEKRTRLIDRLLESPAFAEWWALKWSDLLRNEEKVLDRKGVENFHAWIRQAIERGEPMNEFAREILAARGSTYTSPAANYYRAMRDPILRAESAAQVFLGVRLKCAKCHNHPFDRWTQDDYYGWASLFARVDYKILANDRRDSNDKHEFDGEQIVYLQNKGRVKDPRTGESVPPQLLSGMIEESRENETESTASALRAASDSLPERSNPYGALPRSRAAIEDDPLAGLADWIADPHNRQFARVQVNRLWAELFGRGIVTPVDDFRGTNPPINGELLEWLTDDFIQHDYDLRHSLRTIMHSQTYQLSAEPTPTNIDDDGNFSHTTVRRLSAEQLLDSLCRATGSQLSFTGFPLGMRAAELPGVHALNPRYHHPSPADQFLTTFGKPERLQACSCERTNETTLAQTFSMISGELMTDVLSQKNNAIEQLLSSDRTDSSVVEELYWSILSRAPNPQEREALERRLADAPQRREALEDITWALVNSSEFLLRR